MYITADYITDDYITDYYTTGDYITADQKLYTYSLGEAYLHWGDGCDSSANVA